MKHICVKRIFLNIGMTLAVLAAVFLFHQIYENSFLVKTTGFVQNISVESNMFYYDKHNVRHNFYSYDITYTTQDGQHFIDDILKYEGSYCIGDPVEIIYDKRSPKQIAYRENNLLFIVVFGVPALIMIFFCRSAFKGYKTEYLDRYKKTVIFSVISGWIPILYYIWYEFIFEPSGIIFAGLGEALVCIFLFFAVPIINIIVWIISAVCYCRKCKKSEGSVDKNGSA